MEEVIELKREDFPKTYQFFENIIFPPKFVTWSELQRLIYSSQYEYHRLIGDIDRREEERFEEEFEKIIDVVTEKIGAIEDIEYHDDDFHIENERGEEYEVTIIPKIDQKDRLKLYLVIEKVIRD